VQPYLGTDEDLRIRIERFLEASAIRCSTRQELQHLASISHDRWTRLMEDSEPTDKLLREVVIPLCRVWDSMKGRSNNPWQSLWKVLRRCAYYTADDLHVYEILCADELLRPGEVDALVAKIKTALPGDGWQRAVAAVLIAEGDRSVDNDRLIRAAREIAR
jgi:hypothetical protein